jgi:hypothetical protein
MVSFAVVDMCMQYMDIKMKMAAKSQKKDKEMFSLYPN